MTARSIARVDIFAGSSPAEGVSVEVEVCTVVTAVAAGRAVAVVTAGAGIARVRWVGMTSVFKAVVPEPLRLSSRATSARRLAMSEGMDAAARATRSRASDASVHRFAGSRAVSAATRSSISRGIHGRPAEGLGTSSETWWWTICRGDSSAHGTAPVSIS